MNALRIVIGFVLVTACTTEAPAPSAKADAPANAKLEPTAPADAKAEAGKVEPLSAEDERLIAADPKTLSPDERRKRAFALRRKIMQNPDSETAKMLEDLRRAADNGEIDAPGKAGGMPTFHTRTSPTAPPAGSADGATPTPDDGATKAP